LTDGTANGGSQPSNFWRTDNANQPAATLLASQAAGSTPPPAATVGPQFYNGWQVLTATATLSPYYATTDFCTGQCWYDSDVYTPKGMPDTVYVIGSYEYGEIPCNTKGVGCGNGRSNGRAVVYSTTAGDPETVTTADSTVTPEPSPTSHTTPRTSRRLGAGLTVQSSRSAASRRRSNASGRPTASIRISTRSSSTRPTRRRSSRVPTAA
jgi:hypothetical protein